MRAWLLKQSGALPAPPFSSPDFIPGGIHGLRKYRKKE
jgi:hypothetical protein